MDKIEAASAAEVPFMEPPVLFPRTLGIELVRGCNFDCEMCPVAANAPREAERLQFMSLDLLQGLAAELDRWPSMETIWFFHFGEPLAHPLYRECLEILHRSDVARKAFVIQHTNASLLRGEKADAILDIPVIKRLTFSFDGFGDRESYERMRGPHFDQVLSNIREFSERARKRRPALQLTTCTILPRAGEVPGLPVPAREVALRRLEEIFRPLGVDVSIRDMHDYSGNDRTRVFGRPPGRVAGGCSFVEDNSLYFTVHGHAQPCCAVYDESFHVGRFPSETFGELLNGGKLRWIRHKLRLDQRRDVPFCMNCSLSLSLLGDDGLRRFWLAADARGELHDLAERKHIFGEVVPTPHRVVRMDLGCGTAKQPGFVGVDRFALPGVDVIADLDGPLPFASDSVDLVLASHSMEHVADLTRSMREVFRICKHGAQVCLVEPYGQQGLNWANPYHKQVFNEHTPRFWTASRASLIEPAEYDHPQSSAWGLAESDHSRAGMDFRCLRMEFFYFPEYRGLPPGEQRAARKRYSDVCDQIVYHLVAVKRPVSEAEMNQIARNTDYHDPPHVALRRLHERNLQLESEVQQLRAAQVARETEVSRLLQAHDQELAAAQAARSLKDAQYQLLLQRARELSEKVAAIGEGRWARLRRRVRSRSEDLTGQVGSAFLRLQDDSLIFQDVRGHALRPSQDLRSRVFVSYPLVLSRNDLTAVLLAPILDLPCEQGVLGIEIVSPDVRIVAHVTAPLARILAGAPVRFDFPAPQAAPPGVWELRVFAREAPAAVRVLEWQKYSLLGLWRLKRRAFCGLAFAR